MKGKNNPLAVACAKGERAPRPVELAAAAADLELLQRLCVQEDTLLRWCQQMAKSGTPARVQPASWIAAADELGRVGGGEGGARGGAAAASSSSSASSKKGAGGGAGASMGMGMGMGMGADDAGGDDAGAGAGTGADSDAGGDGGGAILAPASAAARRALREAIAESWSWGEALPALMQHWRDHGVDEVASHSVLTWSPKAGVLKGKKVSRDEEAAEGAAEAGRALGEAWDASPLPGTEELHATVSNSMREHAAYPTHILGAGNPQHILVYGPPGAGKRWLLRSAAGANFAGYGTPAGLRCVCVSRADLRSLPDILAAIREHPRARFVVFLEMPLSLAPYAEFHNELTAALDGGGGGCWPANAQLCATSLTSTALKPGAEDDGAGGQSLAVRFGLSLALEGGGK